jgi:peptidoglycan/xylan/chitin deacetylase (PgdA/CDA1 family)
VYDSTDSRIRTRIRPGAKPSVVLTFDDGPSELLSEIVDVLRAENIQATFFWQSQLLNKATPWKRVLAEGHLIGTHSTEHLDLTTLSYKQQYEDLANSVQTIEQIIGQKVVYFRPPYGQFNEETVEAALNLRLETVLWRVASVDWELENDPQKILTNVVDHLEDGAIILLHELKQTLEILPDLIQAIKTRGYKFNNLPLE